MRLVHLIVPSVLLAAPPSAGSSCTYATPPGAPTGLRVMLVDGRVVRVDVDSGPAATAAGARVGDPESRVLALYEGRITRMPHKYQTAGAYLTVTPGAPQDTLHQIIFETDGRVVTRYRAGTLPQVAWVERCG